jgi:hypothetical protein
VPRLVSLPSLKVPAPPLAEEVVALGVEHAAGVEPADVGDSVLDVLAAFEDQGSIPLLRQHVSGEQPGRPGADDHRAMFQWLRTRLGPVEPLGLEPLDVRARGPRRGAVDGGLDLRRVDEVEVVVPSGVEALAQDPIGRDPVEGDPQPVGQLGGEGLLRLVELEADVGYFPGHDEFCGFGWGHVGWVE